MEQKLVYGMLAVFLCVGLLSVGAVWLMNVPLEARKKNTSEVVSKQESTTDSRVAKTSTPTPQATSTSAAVLGIETDASTFDRDKLYSLINGYRRTNKLSTLKAHTLLEQTAADKLYDMKLNNYWSHRDTQGREPWYLFEKNGYHYEKAGENLSFGYTTEWRVFEEWTKSPEHNAQLLQPNYEHMGLGVDCTSFKTGSETTCIVVLHLGKQLL